MMRRGTMSQRPATSTYQCKLGWPEGKKEWILLCPFYEATMDTKAGCGEKGFKGHIPKQVTWPSTNASNWHVTLQRAAATVFGNHQSCKNHSCSMLVNIEKGNKKKNCGKCMQHCSPIPLSLSTSCLNFISSSLGAPGIPVSARNGDEAVANTSRRTVVNTLRPQHSQHNLVWGCHTWRIEASKCF